MKNDKPDMLLEFFQHTPRLEDIFGLVNQMTGNSKATAEQFGTDIKENWEKVLEDSRAQLDNVSGQIDVTINQATEIGYESIDLTVDNLHEIVAWMRSNLEAVVATGFRIGDAVEQVTEFAGEFARHRVEDTADSLKTISRADSFGDFAERQRETHARIVGNLRDDTTALAQLLPRLGMEIVHPVSDRVSATVEALQKPQTEA